MILKLQRASQAPGGLVKAQITAPASGSGTGSGNLHSHMFPEGVNAAGPGPHLKNH